MSLLVAIEGVDCAGKATQSRLLTERLGGTVLPFPNYEQPAGKAILGHLKDEWSAQAYEGVPGHSHRDPLTDAMVFQALQTVNRLEMLPVIEALRSAGRSIVFDRYSASAMVYGALDGLDPAWIELVNRSLPQPDVQILIDVPVEEGFLRRPERRDRIESNRSYLEKVRAGYLRLFEKRQLSTRIARRVSATMVRQPKATFTEVGASLLANEPLAPIEQDEEDAQPGMRWHIVDGLGTVEEVAQRIWNCVEPLVRG